MSQRTRWRAGWGGHAKARQPHEGDDAAEQNPDQAGEQGDGQRHPAFQEHFADPPGSGSYQSPGMDAYHVMIVALSFRLHRAHEKAGCRQQPPGWIPLPRFRWRQSAWRTAHHTSIVNSLASCSLILAMNASQPASWQCHNTHPTELRQNLCPGWTPRSNRRRFVHDDRIQTAVREIHHGIQRLGIALDGGVIVRQIGNVQISRGPKLRRPSSLQVRLRQDSAVVRLDDDFWVA